MPTWGSLAKHVPRRESWQGERTPPHDLLAEQSAIGGMLLSKDAVADVIETVRGVDFYIPKHEIIFDAILTLYSHGEPTDVIAVTDELTKTGELTQGGCRITCTPSPAWCRPRRTRASTPRSSPRRPCLRRLVEAGTRIVQMGYASEGEVVDLVNNAQAEIYAVTGGVESEDFVPLTDAVTTAIDEIEAANGRDGSDDRRAHRVRRARRADQRPAPGPADHCRGAPGARKVDPRARLRPGRRRPQAADDRVLARDGTK